MKNYKIYENPWIILPGRIMMFDSYEEKNEFLDKSDEELKKYNICDSHIPYIRKIKQERLPF